MPILFKKKLALFGAVLLAIIVFSIILTILMRTPTNQENITIADSLRANGLCYGPFRDGQNPELGLYPTSEQIKEDLVVLKNATGRVRTYSSMLYPWGARNPITGYHFHYRIAELAKQVGLSVYQGVELSNDLEENKAVINRVANLAKQKLVDSVIVGNEMLLAGVLSEANLTNLIQQARQSIPDEIPVTTAEPWSIWLDHPKLAEEADYIMIHVHPFWENQSIDGAAKYVVECYNKVKEKYHKRIVIGETGWPSSGDPIWTGVSSETVPSEANQKRFLEEFVQLAAENSIEYFFFDAFDEEWKWKERFASANIEELTEPKDRTFSGRFTGSSWGLFQSDGELKPQLANFFEEMPSVASRKVREIFVDGHLSAGYDIGVDSSGDRTDWLSNVGIESCMRMSYPSGQNWGAVFITVGKPTESLRQWKDFSNFQNVSFELRGQLGGEHVEIGVKDADDSDDGTETKIGISDLTKSWQTYQFPLSSFQTADLTKLYVVLEFVFSGSAEQTVYFRNINTCKE